MTGSGHCSNEGRDWAEVGSFLEVQWEGFVVKVLECDDETWVRQTGSRSLIGSAKRSGLTMIRKVTRGYRGSVHTSTVVRPEGVKTCGSHKNRVPETNTRRGRSLGEKGSSRVDPGSVRPGRHNEEGLGLETVGPPRFPHQ